jgi:N-ethylmaleimide reductase
MTASLHSPLTVGPFALEHRVVMAPLTRMRAVRGSGGEPRTLNAEYYAQRASPGGLIVSEATQVAPQGSGYPDTPGLHAPEHVAGWREVTDAVHARGGVIFAQLWHVGRISHPRHQPGGAQPVAPSAVAPAGKALLPDFTTVPFETPRALETDEIPALVERFREGARLALEAGFDGVEIHGANGYLIQQFLESHTNLRDDDYGGTVENRARFLMEVTQAAIDVVGADRVAVRLSPFGTANDSGGGEGTMELYAHVLAQLAPLGLAYLHLIEPRGHRGEPVEDEESVAATNFRALWPGVLVVAGGYTPASAARVVSSGGADAVAFGRLFIANPDLPERLRIGAELNAYDRSTFYGGDAPGYTDYPALEGSTV